MREQHSQPDSIVLFRYNKLFTKPIVYDSAERKEIVSHG